jgi:AcrR family transcriptional regulator
MSQRAEVTPGVTIEAGRTQRRSPNRKAQLADAAAELFRRRGYHGVSVNDIAAAAGLTGPAVYRHFHGKQDVLAHVLLTGLERLTQVTDEALGSPDMAPADSLDRLTRAVSTLAVERRDVTALWRWQGRHLDRAERREIRTRGAEVMNRWVAMLRAARPELSHEDAELTCWAALSVFGSVADHHVSLPKRRFERMLTELANAVLAVEIEPAEEPGESTADSEDWRRDVEPVSRREELLSAATRLFRERGYRAVSMEDIGAQAGIAGPSIYRHFTGKAEILVAASYRMADRLSISAERAMTEAADPHDALAGMVRSYVDTVLRSDNLIALYADQAVDVSDRDRRELLRLQRSYVARWVNLLGKVAPELDVAESRIAVHAALTIVNDLIRTPRLASRQGIVDELTTLAITVLDNTSLVRSEENQ